MFSASILLLAQGLPTSEPLALHPRAPHLLIEVPDMGRMLDAYPQAPAMRLVQDEQAQRAFSGLSSQLNVDMSASLSAALSSLGFTLPDDDSTLVDLARRATRVSLSYATHESEAGELERELKQVREAQLEALDIEEALEGHAELGEVELPEALRLDPWQRPYVLTHDGRWLARSLGSDAEIGGQGSAQDIGAELDVESWLENESERRRTLLLVADFIDEPTAANSAQMLLDSMGAESVGEPKPFALAGRLGDLRVFAAKKLDSTSAWMWREGRRVVVGLGAAHAEDVARRCEGAASHFASHDGWPELSKLATTQGVTVIRGAVDTDWMAELVSSAIDLGVATSSEPQFSTPTPTVFSMNLVGERFHTDMVRPASTTSSWWRALGAAAPDPKAWALVPKDAAGSMVARVDANVLEQQLRALVGLEGEGAARLAALEQELGFSLSRDVFGSIEGNLSLFVMPIASIGLPNAVAVVDLKDPAAFERGMQGLAQSFAKNTDGRMQLRTARYREMPMWTFELEQAESSALPFEISPTIAIAGSRAILTTTALFAKREIKRVLGEGADAASANLGAEPLPEGVTMSGSMDWPTMIASFYKSLRGAATLAGSFADLPIDLGALTAGLPNEPEVFTRFFGVTRMWGRPLGDRYHVHMESSFGPETWMGLVGFGAAAVQSMSTSKPAPPPKEAPVESTPPQGDPTAVTREALDRVATRLLVFQLDRGTYPDALKELAEPSPNYPEGYLDGQPLPSDGWGRALSYQRASDGEYKLWSVGPDGVDGTADDVAP
jgi:hypothetical protein